MLRGIDEAAGRYELHGGRVLSFTDAHAFAMAAAWAMNRPELIPPKRLGTRRAFRSYTRAAQAVGNPAAPFRLQSAPIERIDANHPEA